MWLAQHAPLVLKRLRPPLDAPALARAARALGNTLHPSIRAAYRAHDGATGEHSTIFGAMRTRDGGQWVRSMYWLPMDQALRSWRGQRGRGWPAAWLPLGEDGGGNILCADVQSGALEAWDHETGETIRIAEDLDAWAAQLATDMAARLVEATEESEGEALELLKEPRVEPAAQGLAKDRPAWVLIGTLVERRLITLVPGREVAPLAAALTTALRSQSPARRRARVIDALEQSDVIEEIFAADEALDLLIDEFA